MERTKTKLGISLVAMLLTVFMLLGSTYAWFTDSVSNTGNRIQAGKLKISLKQYKDSTWVDVSGEETPIFNYDKWEPGYSDVVLLKVENNGNLAFKYDMNIKQLGESVLEINESGHSLADVIWVYSKVGETTIPEAIPTIIDNTDPLAWHKTLLKDALAETDSAIHGVLLPTGETQSTIPVGEVTMAIILHMDEEAGNEYQNLSLGSNFDIELRATQYTYEEDGFGSNQYDILADGSPDHPEFDRTSVEPTVIKLKVPSNSYKIVRDAEPEDITNGISNTVTVDDMTVVYTAGTKLTEDTSISSDNKSADAEIGFKFVSDTSSIGLTISDDQSVAQYDLTLNIKQDNVILNKVTKFITKGLYNVVAYHNSTTPMTKLTSEDAIPTSDGIAEYYFYNFTTGKLTIWVYHASPVEITYSEVFVAPTDYVAKVSMDNGLTYQYFVEGDYENYNNKTAEGECGNAQSQALQDAFDYALLNKGDTDAKVVIGKNLDLDKYVFWILGSNTLTQDKSAYLAKDLSTAPTAEIDLNGKTINFNNTVSQQGFIFVNCNIIINDSVGTAVLAANPVNYVVFKYQNSNITINGGSYKHATYNALPFWESTGFVKNSSGDEVDNSVVEIKGGVFTMGSFINFNKLVNNTTPSYFYGYIPEGYKAVDNKNGTFSVEQGDRN